MIKFLVKRLFQNMVILFFVGLIVYSLMRFLPSSYLENKARTMAAQLGAESYKELLEQLNATYGLDFGIGTGYFHWLINALQGNWGTSWQWNKPVIEKFNEVIRYSVALSVSAFLLEILIAVPTGIVAAKKQHSKLDHVITLIALISISLPAFLFAMILKYIFALKLKWFELYGIAGRMHEQYSPFRQFLDTAGHMILPVITLTISSNGNLLRHVKTNMLEALNADFIRTARAKGLPESKVMIRHAFRGILTPLITLTGSCLPGLMGGSFIIETIFQIPGIGYTAYQAIINGDIPFSMFYVMMLAVSVITGNLIADILYAATDPRIRIQ